MHIFRGKHLSNRIDLWIVYRHIACGELSPSLVVAFEYCICVCDFFLFACAANEEYTSFKLNVAYIRRDHCE